MRRLLILCSMVLAAAVPLAAAPAGAAGGRTFHVALSGANEVDARGEPSNPHGDADRGTMTVTLNPGTQQVCWSISSITLTPGDALPSAGHIHVAGPATTGPVVVDLFAGSAPAAYPTGTRCVTAPRATIVKILRDPGSYYVNLHNTQHPAGVMRDQLA